MGSLWLRNRRVGYRALVKPLGNYRLAFLIFSAVLTGHAFGGVPILLDDFDNGALDPQWVVSFNGNADGWTFSESGTELTVSDFSTITRFCRNDCATLGHVQLTRSIPYLSDFHVEMDFSWDSMGSEDAMQLLTIYMIGADNASFVWASYVDAWGPGGGGIQWRQSATIGGEQQTGDFNFTNAGSASIEIDRVGSDVTIRWNGGVFHSGTAGSLLRKIRVEFGHYDEVGANGGGAFCSPHTECVFAPERVPSTFGNLSVDLVQVEGTPMPIRYVNQSATGLNNGSSWASAYTQLQDALADATASGGVVDEIWVAAGAYKPDQGAGITLGDRTATFQLQSGVALYGGFNGTETLRSQRNIVANPTILSGDLAGDDGPSPFQNYGENSFHVLDGSGVDSTARLDGFRIVAGNANGPEAQRQSDGGGMLMATGGPGITSSPTIVNCRFELNSASLYGGAIAANYSGATIVNSAFINNRITVPSPTGGVGGAFCSSYGRDTLINCLFVGNTAAWRGGAMLLHDDQGGPGPYTVTNCTFANNSGVAGGALHIAGSNTAVINLTNSIFWGNSDNSGFTEQAQVYRISGVTPTTNYCTIQGLTGALGGTGNTGLDPLFADQDGEDNIPGTADDDLRLLPGSSAIDAGDTTALPVDTLDLDGDGNTTERLSFDLAGSPRVLDDPATIDTGVPGSAVVDMGAYEYFADCNANGLPDVCDNECGAVQGPCDLPGCGQSEDCNGNGIPDECDIAECDGDPACDDCNLNGIPDGCDIGAGAPDLELPFGVPDECVFAAAGINWSDDIWNLTAPDPYPDNLNPDAVSNLHVTLPNMVNLFLDVTVEIDSLRLFNGSTLRVTDLGDGDLTIKSPGNLAVNGEVLVSNDRVVAVPGGDVIIGPAGVYHADGAAAASAGVNSASLVAQDLTLYACLPPCSDDGGLLDLTDSMSATIYGDLTLDGRLAIDPTCVPLSEGFVAGGYTPPVVRIRNQSVLDVAQDMVLLSSVALLMSPEPPLTTPISIGGDFVNESLRPDCFDCRDGGFLLNGTSQLFEVAGTDLGVNGSVDGAEFVMGALEVAAGTAVTFHNGFDNNALGQASCEEALYVEKLTLGAGSSITANNCRVYYETLIRDPSAQIISVGCGEVRSVEQPDSASADPSGLNKSRTISIVPPPQANTAGVNGPIAFKVTLASLHHVVPPYTGGPSIPFTSFEGQVRWVGPPVQYVESSSNPTQFYASQLQCAPHYQDWSAVGLLHVLGSAVVPSSSYRVHTVAASCMGIEASCTAVSAPLEVNTTRWGDVAEAFNPPSITTQPDLGDIATLVNKFRSTPNAPIKARALIAGGDAFGNITSLDLDFGFGHIAACVDAFRGRPYPYTIQACP